MRVFLTGAPGFIGQAVTKELLTHNHTVVGLARSDKSASVVAQTGAEVHRGDIEDLESLKTGAKAADGVIHLAYIHDFSDMGMRAAGVDRAAIQAMAEAMEGTGKPLVIASGTMMLPKGQLANEDTPPEQGSAFAERAKAQDLLFALSKEKNVRGISIRLTPTVHGAGDHGFIQMIIDVSRKNQAVTSVGDGSARWPAVHRSDAAVLFRLALEKGGPATVYHAVAEPEVSTMEIMETIGKRLQLPVEGVSLEEAAKKIDFIAYVISADNPTSSEKTQKELGWQPVQLGLIADMEANYL